MKTNIAVLAIDKWFTSIFDMAALQELRDLGWSGQLLGPEANVSNVIERLHESVVAITSWDSIKFDENILRSAPNLKLICHAAGSVKPILCDELWNRNIIVTSSASAIAMGVGEHCLGLMLSAMKNCYELKEIKNFDDMIPDDIKSAFSHRHDKLANIPLMSYNVGIDDIAKTVNQGYFFLKIKIGSDPDKDGNLDKMLEWDKNRLKEIHETVKNTQTPYTDNGHIPYYFDANGRYDSKDRLMKFIKFAEEIGALDRIILMEEPFPEEFDEDVSDIPVRLAADESAHSDKDALVKIQQGFMALALKPIAKTMSMSLKIAKLAHEQNIPCFCADLTVNPILVDWNKNVAARLPALPGMKIGVLESNGHQNYKNWEQMKKRHPMAGADWIETKDGIFYLSDDFYKHSGGIFENFN